MARSVNIYKRPRPRFFVPIPLIFVAVSALCTLGLDFLNWTRHDPAVIFPLFLRSKAEKPAEPTSAAVKKEEPPPAASKKKEPTLATANKETPASPKKTERLKARFKNKVAVIIDDIGSNPDVVRFLADLKTPITVSILPLSSDARESARIAHEAGLEIMLHIPGESMNHQEEEEEDLNGVYLRTGQTPDEVRKIMEDFLDRVPFIKGVNNHMGSKITLDGSLMREVLDPVKSRRLYFLDSRTNEQSIAYNLARKMGIPSAGRDIFIDAIQEENTIKKRILDLFRLARKQSPVVGIGHPFPETLSALQAMLPLARNYEVELVYASQVVR